jgi:hypothetical protein
MKIVPDDACPCDDPKCHARWPEGELWSDATRIEKAIDLAVQFGGIAGEHHKRWVIDQMVRILAGDSYEATVREAKAGEDGPNTYAWDEGIAP